ncbi:hypothetical protein PAECIP111890_02931 [Paenibacillus sp. JJ-223]|nr:hypothetical protein PAECIP111890_02931 [Paenibacillus sp. JJ-223]
MYTSTIIDKIDANGGSTSMNHPSAYHYYDKRFGPFRNLSSLSEREAETVTAGLREEGRNFASRRSADYMVVRRKLERRARELFIAKGGRPMNPYPHYLTLGACDWLESWYAEPDRIKIGWEQLRADAVSFTYGDLFPTMRYEDGKPYRKKIYTKAEILDVVHTYGWPQDWNRNGDQGPERYIEVQIWDEDLIREHGRA